MLNKIDGDTFLKSFKVLCSFFYYIKYFIKSISIASSKLFTDNIYSLKLQLSSNSRNSLRIVILNLIYPNFASLYASNQSEKKLLCALLSVFLDHPKNIGLNVPVQQFFNKYFELISP